ncbi:MAG: dihydropteroate synthase [Treponema sp.]
MEELFFNCNKKRLKNTEKTILAGILNVTPDSFSDGGKYFNLDAALSQTKKMVDMGIGIIDIGGESTRPGSIAITEEAEIKRVLPAIHAIKKEYKELIISVDTWRANVAKASIEEGADIINDITGLLGDDAMAEVIAKTNCGLIAMFNSVIARPEHEGSKVFRTFSYGKPFSDEKIKHFSTLPILELMKEYFAHTLEKAKNAKIEKNRIMLDPGIGFGLTMRENLELIHNVNLIHQMGHLSFVGVSRKRFIINILKDAGFEANLATEEGLNMADYASAFLSAIASYNGVNVLRVHDVAKHFKAILIGDAIRMSNLAKDTNFSQYKAPNK